MGDSLPMCDAIEHQRRKKAAQGRPVRLADGQPWLLAEPAFRPGPMGLTTPDIDAEIDRFHEQIVLGEDFSLVDIHAVARKLLLFNYDLTDEDVAELLEVEAGTEAEALARATLELVFGPDHRARSYVDWVRASLLANGLAQTDIPASAINDVLTVMIATNRTIPPSQFVDSCRAARNRDSLERLV
jgi:hypothetical protein